MVGEIDAGKRPRRFIAVSLPAHGSGPLHRGRQRPSEAFLKSSYPLPDPRRSPPAADPLKGSAAVLLVNYSPLVRKLAVRLRSPERNLRCAFSSSKTMTAWPTSPPRG